MGAFFVELAICSQGHRCRCNRPDRNVAPNQICARVDKLSNERIWIGLFSRLGEKPSFARPRKQAVAGYLISIRHLYVLGRLFFRNPYQSPCQLACEHGRHRRRHRCRGHACCYTPREARISARDVMSPIAAKVALITFNGLLDPLDFVNRSRIPSDSATARMHAPAITPVPGFAGNKSTRDAPNLPVTACGIVLPCLGTLIIRLAASFTAFSTAIGTSFPLP